MNEINQSCYIKQWLLIAYRIYACIKILSSKVGIRSLDFGYLLFVSREDFEATVVQWYHAGLQVNRLSD